ncbi:hypothetical protein PLCT1_01523 [Planctomycetaceae bacterium]|nr:hypothetical protein PLCT1_01523 [Planctomycetaceae bacterium]
MVRTLVLIGLLAASVPTLAAAQDRDRKYTVGIRSALITGTMDLSGLDPAFDDLTSDGLVGPHMSGYFLTYKVRPYLRIGIETLVSNSDQTAATTMNYQAAGPVVELTYGAKWFISGGVHAGALVVNAMARQGPAPSGGASTGSFYKGEGLFLAPYADIGYRFRRSELGVFLKQVNISGESDRGGISEFGSTFVGLRFAVGL